MELSTPSPRPQKVLVGRSSEIATLTTCLEQALAGQGNTALLGGEAGIGKSSVVEELRTRAGARGALVCIGYCYDLSAPQPYGPWVDLFSNSPQLNEHPSASTVFEDSGDPAPARDQQAVFGDVHRAIAEISVSNPVVIILEDLHWVDSASLELLRAVSRRIRSLPVMIVITYRHDEITRDNPLYRTLPHLVRESQAQRIELDRLDEAATSAIVQARYHLPPSDETSLSSYLHSRAEGNPFYIGELLYALEEQGVLRAIGKQWTLDTSAIPLSLNTVPMLVRQLIDNRLDRLSPTTRRLLEIAAVTGPDVPLELWRELAGLDEEAFIHEIYMAIEARFLQESLDRSRIEFHHALVRDALYAGLILPERRSLHLRAAEALEQQGTRADSIANHFALAGDRRAIHWLTQAGESALQLYAPETAVEHFSRAIEFARSLGTEPPVAALHARGHAYATIGEFSRARADYSAALEAAQGAGDRLAEWRDLVELGTLWSTRDYGRTRRLYDSALALAREIGDDTTIAHSLMKVSNWYLNNNQPVEAIHHGVEALGIFERSGDVQGVAATVRMLAMDYLARGDLIAANRRFREAIDHFDLLDDRYGLCSALTGLLYTAGTYTFHTEIPGPIDETEVRDVSDRAIELAKDTGWRAGEAYIYLALASYHGIRGNYLDAVDLIQQGLSVAGEIDHREWIALGHQILGRLHLDLFSFDTAELYLTRSLETAAKVGAPLHGRLAAAYLAHVDINRGELQAALGRLAGPLDLDLPPQTVIGRKGWATQASIALAAGQPEHALAIVERLIETTLNTSPQHVVPLHNRLRSEALTQLRRFEESKDHLLVAIESATASGYLPVLWRLHVALGRLYLEWQRDREADSAFSDARELVNELASAIPDDELRANYLHQTADRIPAPRNMTALQSAKLRYDGLTARQREVAALVARGYSNSEIAAELHISGRTAEGHVTAILTTLDFTSRAQIAAWAVDRKLVEL